MKKLWELISSKIKGYYHYIPYGILLMMVVLPYLIRGGHFLAGNDTSFFEYASGYNFQRSLYYWRNLNGVGGESFQGAGTLVYLALVRVLQFLTGSLVTQVLTKALFYSAGFWGMYLLLKEYTQLQKKTFSPFVASLLGYFYCVNLIGFDLIRTWLYLYYIFFLLTPLLSYFFLKAILDKRKRFFIGFIACTILNQIVFSNASYPAIQYIVLLVLSGVFLKKDQFWSAFKILIVFSLLNAPFFFENVLAILYQRANLFSNSVNAQLINDAPTVQQKFYSIFNILSFTSGRLLEGTRWTMDGSKGIFPIAAFYLNTLVRYVFLIPIGLIIQHISKNNLETRTRLVGLLLLLSMVLVSMFGFGPLSGVFTRVFDALPLLWIFRNSLKFSVPLLIFTSFLLSESLTKKIAVCFFSFYLLVLSVYGFTGYFADEYSFTSIPATYSALPNEISKLSFAQGDRIMAFPAHGNLWLVYSFGYMGFHPLVSFQNELPSLTTDAYASGAASNVIYDELAVLNDGSVDLFKKYSVKYLFLNHDLNYNAYRIDQNQYQKDKEFLDEHFKKVLDNQQYAIYQTYDANTPIVSGYKVTYSMVNPTKYHVTLHQVTTTRELILNQSYSSGWKLYPEEGEQTDLHEANQSFSFLEGDELKYLTLDDKFWWTHRIVNGYANQWTIDKADPANTVHQTLNSDGSVDIQLVLFFQPQVYYYIAEIIVLATLIGCLGFVIYRKKYASYS